MRTICALLLAAGLPAARGASLDDLLKGIEQHYNTAKTLQADFVQTYTYRGRKTTEKGALYLRKPGRMRWQYSMPAGKLWVSDGEFVYSYDPDEKRVEKSKLKESGDLQAPLAFLLGKLNFHDDFRQFTASPEGADTKIVALPKSDKFPYTEVSFVASPNFLIKHLSVKGADGSVMDYIFDNEKKDPLLTDALFKFNPPPDVAVVDASKVN
ncbi:MAG: outer membrane lipoprotein carrier protein LolA [Bryobacterales bacterium]|nr:outer membrane lipoprotein carrier protein LolA [Bryobacterales bacterium]MBV9400402.1 outer membrane lipoprotein carrier protein LolA [Bryobacterales bacterium]